MRNMPKVSIIVPVYNVGSCLTKCLESLVNQTLDDIEIIAVNDGSTDESRDILRLYEKKYRKKIMVLDKENGGLSDARNFGMPYATGEYIAFLDSDDYVELDTYEKLYNKAKEENSDMVECDFLWEYPKKIKYDKGVEYSTKKDMVIHGRVVAWNKLIKREVIEKAKIQYPKGLRYEDVEFFYKMVPYYNKVSFVKEYLIHYVQRDNSIVNSQNERNGEIFTVLDNVIEYYENNNLYTDYKQELEYTYARISLCSSLFRVAKVKNKNSRKKLEDMTWECLNEKFPNWKKNTIIRNLKNTKGIYMRLMNKYTFKIFCFIFHIIKQ